MVTYILNIIFVILGVLLVCVFLFLVLVIFLIGKGFDNREKEAQELLRKMKEQNREQGM